MRKVQKILFISVVIKITVIQFIHLRGIINYVIHMVFKECDSGIHVVFEICDSSTTIGV